MKAHLRQVHNDYCLPIQTLAGRVLISLTNHLEGSTSRPLEADTSFAFPCAEVMKEIGHLVLLFFLFASKGRLDIGETQGTKSSTLALGALSRSSTRLPFLDAWGGRTGTLFLKKKTLETTTPIVLLGYFEDRVGILPSQRRLPGLGTDHQFQTNRLDLKILSWRRAAWGQIQEINNNIMLALHYFCGKMAWNNWKNIGRGTMTQLTKIPHS